MKIWKEDIVATKEFRELKKRSEIFKDFNQKKKNQNQKNLHQVLMMEQAWNMAS